MAGNRLTVCQQELLWAFARLVNISSNYLFLLVTCWVTVKLCSHWASCWNTYTS